MVDQRLEIDIINASQSELLSTESSDGMDTSAGSVVTDIALEGLSKQLADTSTEIVDAEEVIALDKPTDVSTEDFDKKAANYKATRVQATYATGTVIFFKRFVPTGTITISAGTRVSTSPDDPSNRVYFYTTETVTFTVSTPKNSTTNRWEVSAAVQAETAGTVGTAGRNTVDTIIFPISGVDGVNNSLAINTGVEDTETNTEFATRIKTEVTAESNIGTRTGYQDIIVENYSSALAADVVGPKDSANKRNEFGNEIDIYIIGQEPTSFTDLVSYDGTTSSYLSTRPVLSVSSVIGSTTGQVFTQTTNWEFIQDTSPAYGYSTKSLDRLNWVGPTPVFGIGLSISGIYEKNVGTVQNFLLDASRRVVATSLLVKDGQKVLIDVYIKIAVLPGYTKATVQTNVQAALTDYLSSLVLGAAIEQADLVSVAAGVTGVDNVVIPFTTLKKSTEASGTVHDITLPRSQYPRMGTLTVEVL